MNSETRILLEDTIYAGRSYRQTGIESWHTNGLYETTFHPILGGKTLPEMVQETKDKNGKALVLDLMGYGDVLRRLPIDVGLAVALTDPRNEAQKSCDATHGISLVTRNVLSGRTWFEIKSWIENQGRGSKFDMVLCRPMAGIGAIPNDPDIYYYLLQKAWEVLSNQNGILLSEAPWKSQGILKDWTTLLKLHNIDGSYVLNEGHDLRCVPNHIFKLKKSPDSPKILPTV